jgi:hypothetical protein
MLGEIGRLDSCMLQLVYASAATLLFTRKDLVNLLKVARERNAASGINDMLLYHNKSFLQVLEGPKERVGALFTKIEKDPRHKNVLVLLRREIQEKEFENWSMGFVDTSKMAAQFEGFVDYVTQLESMTLDKTGARRFLRKFQEGAWRRSEYGGCF